MTSQIVAKLFSIGQRHNLQQINILNDDGTMNSNAGKFAGQKRFDTRYAVVEELTKLGLFVEKKDNPMKVPLCSKSKDVIGKCDTETKIYSSTNSFLRTNHEYVLVNIPRHLFKH